MGRVLVGMRYPDATVTGWWISGVVLQPQNEVAKTTLAHLS